MSVPSRGGRIINTLGLAGLVAALFLLVPPGAAAQPRTHTVGMVSHVQIPSSLEFLAKGLAVFRQELDRLGYVEGQNLRLHSRFGPPSQSDPVADVREVVQSGVDVLVPVWSPASLAARRATTSVPIVAIGPRDPVEQGLIVSFGRPGGNITGVSSSVGNPGGKRLQILKEIAPHVSRVAYLTNLGFPATQPHVTPMERAGAKVGLTLQSFDVRSEADVDRAFTEIVRKGLGGVVVAAEVRWSNVIVLAAKHRLPAVYTYREDVENGGLVSWDIDRLDLFRRGAYLVDRVLKGTKPADLPFEQPTKFELVINLKAAKALRLVVPPALLTSATEVLQ